MLGFSPLASKAIADDGIVRITFNADDIVAGAPTISTPTLTVSYNFTSGEFNLGAPSIDTPTLTISYDFTGANITVGSPVVDSPRLLGTPALSRLDIDGPNDIILVDSYSDVIITSDSVTTVILDESYLLAEVA
jgi:hypothetical protein